MIPRIVEAGGRLVLQNGHLIYKGTAAPAIIAATPPPSAGGGGGGTSPDGFAPGLYFPDTVYVNPNEGGYNNPIATGFCRPLNTWIYSWVSDQPTESIGLLPAGNGCTMQVGVGFAAGTYTGTLTATFGATVYTKRVTIISDARAVQIPNNYVLDTLGYGNYGSPGPTYGSVAGGQNPGNAVYTVTDPSGLFVSGSGTPSSIYTQAPVATLRQNYGRHDITLNLSSGFAQPQTIWIIEELPPVGSFVGGQLYDNSQPGDIFGQVHAYSDAGISAIAITANPENAFTASAGGLIAIKGTLTAGAGQVLSLLLTSNTGKTSPLNITFTVLAGSTLDASHIANTFSSSLDNSMTAGTVGSAHISGMSAPVWASITLVNDASQTQGLSGGNTAYPRYTGTPRAGDPTTLDVTYAALSAQTDTLVLYARQGPLLCTASIPITIAAVAGPSVTIGLSGSGANYDTIWHAQDAAWSGGLAAGAVVTLNPGPTYGGYDELARTQLGHGSAQFYWPFPVTLQGPSPTARALIDVAGQAPAGTKAAFDCVNFDITFRNILGKNCSNFSGTGYANAGFFNKENLTWGNVSVFDSIITNSDFSYHSGDHGTTATMKNVLIMCCGAGAGGLTHNVYADGGKLLMTNVMSTCTAQVYALKSRTIYGTYTNCFFIGGENGAPGSSAAVDLPNGGVHGFTNCVLSNSPSPNGAGAILLTCEEAGGGNGTARDVNAITLDGCKILNLAPPGSISSPIIGLDLRNDHGGAYSPTTGLPVQIIVKNTGFYNLSKAQWWRSATGAANIIDGGGNYALTTYPDCPLLDPSTGAALDAGSAPNPGYSKWVQSYDGIMCVWQDSNQMRVALNAAAGTHVTTLIAVDVTGALLTNLSITLTSTSGGMFTTRQTDTSHVEIITAKAMTDGLMWFSCMASGTNSAGATANYGGYNGTPKNFFVVGGPGTVAAIP